MLLPGPYPDIRVRKEAVALDAAGYAVTVFCLGDGPRRETVDGVRVRRFPADDARAHAAAAVDAAGDLLTGVRPRWLAALDRFLRARDVAAVHVHDLPLVRTALVARRRHGVPVVADCHENYPEAVRQWHRTHADHPLRYAAQTVRRTAFPVSRWKRVERRVLPAADRVLAVCETARDHYVDDCGVDPAAVTVVGNTVELDVFDPETAAAPPPDAGRGTDGTGVDADGNVRAAAAPGPDDALTAVYVGGFGPHRGLETAVEAVAQSPGVRLRLVGGGGGDTAADLRALAARRGVADRVDLPGRVPFAAVPAVLAAADVCLVPHADTPPHRDDGPAQTVPVHGDGAAGRRLRPPAAAGGGRRRRRGPARARRRRRGVGRRVRDAPGGPGGARALRRERPSGGRRPLQLGARRRATGRLLRTARGVVVRRRERAGLVGFAGVRRCGRASGARGTTRPPAAPPRSGDRARPRPGRGPSGRTPSPRASAGGRAGVPAGRVPSRGRGCRGGGPCRRRDRAARARGTAAGACRRRARRTRRPSRGRNSGGGSYELRSHQRPQSTPLISQSFMWGRPSSPRVVSLPPATVAPTSEWTPRRSRWETDCSEISSASAMSPSVAPRGTR
ncbi:glycosyltransferase [Candidatus Halobonum tyrrellensis G22]|uniref:Glycosyltransferase n=1 Tax=Candidatus Halobonum tyrrellensis G22 TaxID=1324957 RepID=V4GNH0_9EURY|nr:glycosyltransferase [Candidatus Halobonum tyrrellensis G22]